jgi:hypothetical protein
MDAQNIGAAVVVSDSGPAAGFDSPASRHATRTGTPAGSHAERVLRARIGGLARAAKHDNREMTAAARAVGPASVDYWLRQVDPDLPEPERLRQADRLKRLHFARLALKSAKARSRSRKKAS